MKGVSIGPQDGGVVSTVVWHKTDLEINSKMYLSYRLVNNEGGAIHVTLFICNKADNSNIAGAGLHCTFIAEFLQLPHNDLAKMVHATWISCLSVDKCAWLDDKVFFRLKKHCTLKYVPQLLIHTCAGKIRCNVAKLDTKMIPRTYSVTIFKLKYCNCHTICSNILSQWQCQTQAVYEDWYLLFSTFKIMRENPTAITIGFLASR